MANEYRLMAHNSADTHLKLALLQLADEFEQEAQREERAVVVGDDGDGSFSPD